VLVRFLLRLALLSGFGILGSLGFGASLSALATMAAIVCATVAAMRQEAIFGPVLTHWDEATACIVIAWVTRLI
jgi:hypothetical protein